MEEEKFVCAECGEEFNLDEMTEVNGEFYCQDCFEELFVSCEDCGELVYKENARYVENYGWICEYCKEFGDYHYCSHCNNLFRGEDIIWDNDDYAYCAECRDWGYGDFGSIRSYHDHKDNEEPIFFGGSEYDCDNLFMGVELEIDSDYLLKNNQNASAVKDMFPDDFIFMEDDCSLDHGFENITNPATLEYHTSIKDIYKKVFKFYLDSGYVSHNKETCGLHVHFNRSFFGDKEEECVTKLCYIFEKFWDNFVKFSRRSEVKLNRWAKRYAEAHDEVYKKSKNGDYDRYYAINLTNEETIEIRMFKGTLRWDTFIATLQMVDNVARICKNVDVSVIRSMTWEDLLVTDELKAYWETVKNRRI